MENNGQGKFCSTSSSPLTRNGGQKTPQMPFLAPHSFLVGKKDKESVAGEVRTSTHTLLLLKALLMHNGSLAEQKDWGGENAV